MLYMMYMFVWICLSRLIHVVMGQMNESSVAVNNYIATLISVMTQHFTLSEYSRQQWATDGHRRVSSLYDPVVVLAMPLSVSQSTVCIFYD